MHERKAQHRQGDQPAHEDNLPQPDSGTFPNYRLVYHRFIPESRQGGSFADADQTAVPLTTRQNPAGRLNRPVGRTRSAYRMTTDSAGGCFVKNATA